MVRWRISSFGFVGSPTREGGFGLSTAEGTRSHYQPGLCGDQGGERVQGQDHRHQPALADRLTYLKITGWGWYYLSTVLDDFSRYIVTWRLGPTMCASDVTATLDQALAASGLDHITVAHRPRLLSDNGSSYMADDLTKWLEDKGMQHVRGAPYHPQTQGKIERWHQTLKNRILLDNYYLPGDLERQITPSSNTTITSAIMRASKTSHRPTSTLAEPRRSSQNANASSSPPSQTAACSIDCRPLKL